MRTTIRVWGLVLAVLLAIPVFGGTAVSAQSVSTTGGSSSVTPAQPAAGRFVDGGRFVANDCCHISIPSNYVYNLNARHPTLHDYCSYSPDEFPAPGTNANFRGPCARHDMCYQYHQQSQHGCDNSLFVNLGLECKYTYGTFDPRRYACIDTAAVYWAAVTVHTYWP